MLVPPLSNESRTRNDSPVPERLFELSNLLKRTLSPADHAFALRAALEAHAMGADESAVVATAAACGLDRAGEALEPLLTLEELAAASRISVGLLNVRAVAHSSDAVADGMLALARVRIRELLDDARLHSGPDDAALEAAELALRDAFFTYDDILFTQLGVELPFDILDDSDEEDDDFDDSDEDEDDGDEDDEDDDFIEVDD